jgi:isoaspartyl peptidase/L-asparaginase-like protein (Ntn-hydrolase superfamily)
MQPIILSTWSFGPVGNEPGMAVLRAGASALDAAVAAATVVEDDPAINSVGVGGMPDADGEVSLDACVMENPGRSGAVCYLRHYPNAAAVARAVMEKTIHTMLAGTGAEAFAAREGFQRRELLTEAARAEWEQWRRDPKQVDRDRYRGWIPPLNVEERREGGSAECRVPSAECRESHDTYSVLALDQQGRLAGACTTSGMAFKVPGRVGDSPIIGHGLYVDQTDGKAGSAAATGTGEVISSVCASFLAVELMRQGRSASEALAEVLARVTQRFRLHPDHQVALIALTPRGEWASASLRPGFQHTITDERGTRVEPAGFVLLSA